MNEHSGSASSTPEPSDELRLLSALVDGELSDSERAAVEARLAQDPAATARVADYRAQNAALQALFPLSRDVPSLFVQRRMPWWKLWLSAGAVLAAGVVLGTVLSYGMLNRTEDTAAFAHRADLAYAVYAPEQRHPVEVAGDQQAHLLAWLSKRLNKPLVVPSLDEYGYTLVGGRLLPGETGPAAQFMFQNQVGDRLTLYVTVLRQGESTMQLLRVDGRRTVYWANQGMGYAMSGQGDESKLRAIASDVCSALGGRATWKG